MSFSSQRMAEKDYSLPLWEALNRMFDQGFAGQHSLASRVEPVSGYRIARESAYTSLLVPQGIQRPVYGYTV